MTKPTEEQLEADSRKAQERVQAAPYGSEAHKRAAFDYWAVQAELVRIRKDAMKARKARDLELAGARVTT